MPFHENPRPQELLTQANAILGQGQLSLAKFLFIVNRFDDEQLDIHDIPAFFRHMLTRVDWRRDLHFQTNTTIDTLDYSGDGLNMGSKVVIAAVGKPIRELATEISSELGLPEGYRNPRVALPGVLVIEGPRVQDGEKERRREGEKERHDLSSLSIPPSLRLSVSQFPLVVLADDSDFTSRSLANFLWVTFTRANPAADIYGVGACTDRKHWGCTGPLVIDARIKPHHAPPLVEDPDVSKRIDALAARGGPLAKWL
jgi:4-hydroxy-3-polyprenylbenzoate decarboxylase